MFMDKKYVSGRQAAEILHCTRQNISILVLKDQLHPIVDAPFIFLKKDILQYKRRKLKKSEIDFMPKRIKKGTIVRYYQEDSDDDIRYIYGKVISGTAIKSSTGTDIIKVMFENGREIEIEVNKIKVIKSRAKCKEDINEK